MFKLHYWIRVYKSYWINATCFKLLFFCIGHEKSSNFEGLPIFYVNINKIFVGVIFIHCASEKCHSVEVHLPLPKNIIYLNMYGKKVFFNLQSNHLALHWDQGKTKKCCPCKFLFSLKLHDEKYMYYIFKVYPFFFRFLWRTYLRIQRVTNILFSPCQKFFSWRQQKRKLFHIYLLSRKMFR